MRSRHTPVRRSLAAAVVAGSLGLLGAGCAADPDPSPPAGVDELTIPTPSPDPGDFVATVDNPWFPLERGTEQRYSFGGTGPGGGLRVSVLAEERLVAGVRTTVVETVATFADPADGVDGADGAAEGGWETGVVDTDFYAQDGDGNVWWFGREGEWEAGVDGAQAGLVMAETPRYGDGYRTAYLPGVVERRASVMAVDGDRVEVRYVDPLLPGSTEDVTYERGVGVVRVEGTDSVLERVSDPA